MEDETNFADFEYQIHKISILYKSYIENVNQKLNLIRQRIPIFKIESNPNPELNILGLTAKRTSISKFGTSLYLVNSIASLFYFNNNKWDFKSNFIEFDSNIIDDFQFDARIRLRLILVFYRLISNLISKNIIPNLIITDIPPYIPPNLISLYKIWCKDEYNHYKEIISKIFDQCSNKSSIILLSNQMRGSIFNTNCVEQNLEFNNLIEFSKQKISERLILSKLLEKPGQRTPFYEYIYSEFLPSFEKKNFLYCYFKSPTNDIIQFEISKYYTDLKTAIAMLNIIYRLLENSVSNEILPVFSASKSFSISQANEMLKSLIKLSGIFQNE